MESFYQKQLFETRFAQHGSNFLLYNLVCFVFLLGGEASSSKCLLIALFLGAANWAVSLKDSFDNKTKVLILLQVEAVTIANLVFGNSYVELQLVLVSTFCTEALVSYSKNSLALVTAKSLIQNLFLLKDSLDILKFALLYCALYKFFLTQMLSKLSIYKAYDRQKSLRRHLQKQKHLLEFCCSEGLAVVSRNMRILRVNDKLSYLLDCEKTRISEGLWELEYLLNKKYTQELTNSNSVLEDVEFCLAEKPYGKYLLGVAETPVASLQVTLVKAEYSGRVKGFISFTDIKYSLDTEKAQSQEHCKSLLAKTISHELKTPMNPIISFSSKLKNKEKYQKTSFRMIYVSANILMSIINDFLDFSKIVSGNFYLQNSEFSFFSLVDEVFELLEVQTQKKGLKMCKRLHESLPETIFTDRNRLKQVVLKLMRNAVKFSRTNGVELAAFVDSRQLLKVTVKDSCYGLPENILLELRKDLNSDLTCIGLGLHITKLLIEKLGGKLSVKSKPSVGCEFTFTVQISEPTEEYSSGSDISIGISEEMLPVKVNFFTPFESKRYVPVLVVDDNEINRLAVCSILKKENIDCEEACNGKEALDKVTECDQLQKPFKVIILDCGMPVMDGWEASRTINKLFFQGRIKSKPQIIGYTALSSEKDVKKCFESGMDKYLPKPSTVPEIVNSVVRSL